MRNFLIALLVIAGSACSFAQDHYRVHLDLAGIRNDRLRVMIFPPKITTDTATWVFTNSVPGTYEEHFWHRMVSNFRAYDSGSVELPVHRSADSMFVVSRAQDLRYLSYELDDSFDDTTGRIKVFAPAGTAFEEDSIFVLNHGGIVCFIEGMQKRPFNVTVRRPRHLIGGSSLQIQTLNDSVDTYSARSYDELVDSPTIFSLPDTATFRVAGVDVLVQCAHSGSDNVARVYADELAKHCATIARFLPSMPVSRYAFLFYLWRGDRTKVARPFEMGALEHNTSSFYFLGFQRKPIGLSEISIHEFLHILVPLNLHSHEIHEFNFRRPVMSQHLWLYEGTTEYFATLAPLHDKTLKEDRFRSEMQGKLRSSSLPATFSLTEFSRDVLSEANQELYPQIYTYGAVNAFYLDIVMRSASGGKQGLLDVVLSLMKEFGPNRPFHDDSLFDHIERVTGPKVRAYLDTYVKGRNQIPSAEILPLIGWKYIPEKRSKILGYAIDADFTMVDGKPTMRLSPEGEINPLKLQNGDLLVSVNDVPMAELFESPEGRTMMRKLRSPADGDTLKLVVRRSGVDVELSGQATQVDKIDKHFFENDPAATPEQIALRNAVFYE
jgi:predicted metalloprotease with PDZ domain